MVERRRCSAGKRAGKRAMQRCRVRKHASREQSGGCTYVVMLSDKVPIHQLEVHNRAPRLLPIQTVSTPDKTTTRWRNGTEGSKRHGVEGAPCRRP
eukprot:1404263-Rhodomonas_salina.4